MFNLKQIKIKLNIQNKLFIIMIQKIKYLYNITLCETIISNNLIIVQTCFFKTFYNFNLCYLIFVECLILV